MQKSKLREDNILVIGDTHIPFEHSLYLEFCKEIQWKCKCGTVVHIGDLVDLHSCSYHEHHPDGFGPADEMKEADKHLASWFKAFPTLRLCFGNHDRIVDRKGRTAGLPSRCFTPFEDMWNLPKTWECGFEFVIDGVLYKHGTGFAGRYAHVTAAERSRMSTVMGHTHSSSGVEYIASSKDLIFAMGVGCGIDKNSYAFSYGKDFPRKPILSCGIVSDKGKYCQVFPMQI